MRCDGVQSCSTAGTREGLRCVAPSGRRLRRTPIHNKRADWLLGFPVRLRAEGFNQALAEAELQHHGGEVERTTGKRPDQPDSMIAIALSNISRIDFPVIAWSVRNEYVHKNCVQARDFTDYLQGPKLRELLLDLISRFLGSATQMALRQ